MSNEQSRMEEESDESSKLKASAIMIVSEHGLQSLSPEKAAKLLQLYLDQLAHQKSDHVPKEESNDLVKQDIPHSDSSESITISMDDLKNPERLQQLQTQLLQIQKQIQAEQKELKEQQRMFQQQLMQKQQFSPYNGRGQGSPCFSSFANKKQFKAHGKNKPSFTKQGTMNCSSHFNHSLSATSSEAGEFPLEDDEDFLLHDTEQNSLIEFALKLGYNESQVKTALNNLKKDADQNELLNELIKLCSGDANGEKSEFINQNEFKENETTELRPIVIDGSNVALSHGNKEVFSCKGIKLAVDYFRTRGHKEITVFVPMWRKENLRTDQDKEILSQLEADRLLVFTPSRNVNGHRINCYDDRYILRLALENQGIIVSNDNYRDLVNENPIYKRLVQNRLLMYTFVNDRFMPPDDPLGKYGPTLDVFLRKETELPSAPMGNKVNSSVTATQQAKYASLCPYFKKCTYGNKCKYFHPERIGTQTKSVAERLMKQSKEQLQKVKARAMSMTMGKNDKNASSMIPGSPVSNFAQLKKKKVSKTGSLPLSLTSEDLRNVKGPTHALLSRNSFARENSGLAQHRPLSNSCSLDLEYGSFADQYTQQQLQQNSQQQLQQHSQMQAQLHKQASLMSNSNNCEDGLSNYASMHYMSNQPMMNNLLGHHKIVSKKLSEPSTICANASKLKLETVKSYHSCDSPSSVDLFEAPAQFNRAVGSTNFSFESASSGIGSSGSGSLSSSSGYLQNSNLHPKLQRQLTINPYDQIFANRPQSSSSSEFFGLADTLGQMTIQDTSLVDDQFSPSCSSAFSSSTIKFGQTAFDFSTVDQDELSLQRLRSFNSSNSGFSSGLPFDQ